MTQSDDTPDIPIDSSAHRERIAALKLAHIDIGTNLVTQCNGTVYACDAMALALIQRSISQLRAFCLLIENGLHPTAVAVLRMQLDNALRLWGVTHCADPHDVAQKVRDGKHLRKIPGPNNLPMTDQNLCTQVAVDHPFVEVLYQDTSAFIHLSDMHFLHWEAINRQVYGDSGYIGISDSDGNVSNESKLRVMWIFLDVTELTLRFVKDWTVARSLAPVPDRSR